MQPSQVELALLPAVVPSPGKQGAVRAQDMGAQSQPGFAMVWAARHVPAGPSGQFRVELELVVHAGLRAVDP